MTRAHALVVTLLDEGALDSARWLRHREHLQRSRISSHARIRIDVDTVVQRAVAGEPVRAEPFDAIELRVGVLFGDEEDD
jgi:hypothetical protein